MFISVPLKKMLPLQFYLVYFALQTLQYPFANSNVFSASRSAEQCCETLITQQSLAELQIGLN